MNFYMSFPSTMGVYMSFHMLLPWTINLCQPDAGFAQPDRAKSWLTALAPKSNGAQKLNTSDCQNDPIGLFAIPDYYKQTIKISAKPSKQAVFAGQGILTTSHDAKPQQTSVATSLTRLWHMAGSICYILYYLVSGHCTTIATRLPT